MINISYDTNVTHKDRSHEISEVIRDVFIFKHNGSLTVEVNGKVLLFVRDASVDDFELTITDKKKIKGA